MPEKRLVGGLWCDDVLAALPEYLDGSLPAAVRGQAEQHLAGCTWCEQFGGDYAELVQVIKARLAEPDPVPPDLARLLMERLADEPRSES